MVRTAGRRAEKNPPPPAEPQPPEPDDKHRFLEAMSDVIPLSDGKSKAAPPSAPRGRPSHPLRDDERAAVAHLSQLVRGQVEMDITLTDEYMEGAVRGVGPRIMRRLKRGQFPVQDHVDLHGLTKEAAERRLREFLLQSHRLGHRCVLVVHGRGLNSPDSFPILKARMPVWLRRGPLKRIVLAFVTAKPYDGGAGAVYVLLRKR